MRKMIQVNVTKLDIQRGTQGSARTCPVARALRRTLKIKRANHKDGSVCVRYYGVHIKKNGKHYEFADRTSQKRNTNLQRFVFRFDAGNKVEPCKLFLVQR